MKIINKIFQVLFGTFFIAGNINHVFSIINTIVHGDFRHYSYNVYVTELTSTIIDLAFTALTILGAAVFIIFVLFSAPKKAIIITSRCFAHVVAIHFLSVAIATGFYKKSWESLFIVLMILILTIGLFDIITSIKKWKKASLILSIVSLSILVITYILYMPSTLPMLSLYEGNLFYIYIRACTLLSLVFLLFTLSLAMCSDNQAKGEDKFSSCPEPNKDYDSSLASKLKCLKKLLDEGVITEDEYANKRKKCIDDF